MSTLLNLLCLLVSLSLLGQNTWYRQVTGGRVYFGWLKVSLHDWPSLMQKYHGRRCGKSKDANPMPWWLHST